MKASDFKIWLEQLPRLSRGQLEQVKQHVGQADPHSAVVKVLDQLEMRCCPCSQADRPYR
jgi:hypothetical protein